MFRRRRRRSAFGRRQAPIQPWMALAAGGAVLIGLMIFFIRQSEVLAPPPHEISVPLPDAFKETP